MSDENKNSVDEIRGVIFYPTSEWSLNFDIKLNNELKELIKKIKEEKGKK